ncbi:MAG: fumarylacetoacetate hydrolase family protein, partial [Pusillimonas sp.]|nr:fumarylacetoacetate hydrolase family protein [Pusillimonas sp.]
YIPTGCANFDWEAEMVVVFGRGGRNIPKDKALDCVAGYMLGVDFTARDQMAAPPPFVFDFTLGKCQDRTAPVGPYVVPKEFVDGADIHFSLSVNGVQKQSTTTAKMIYSLQEQISGISKRVQIEPGDIMFTGSPAGVGAAHNESAHAGDLIVLSSPQLGELRVTLGSAPSTYQPV